LAHPLETFLATSGEVRYWPSRGKKSFRRPCTKQNLLIQAVRSGCTCVCVTDLSHSKGKLTAKKSLQGEKKRCHAAECVHTQTRTRKRIIRSCARRISNKPWFSFVRRARASTAHNTLTQWKHLSGQQKSLEQVNISHLA